MDEPNKFQLGDGVTAEDTYSQLQKGGRAAVCEMGRRMAELTIPSVFPPDGYKPGDNLPGNNQSLGTRCVNNLASNLMFMAFPPGQPIVRIEVIEHKIQEEVDKDPALWTKTQLALSRLELAHRKRLATTGLATAYNGYIKLLLIAGNALWKHIELDTPTYHLPSCYVVKRNRGGTPLVTVHKETVSLQSLDPETREEVESHLDPETLKQQKEWEKEVDIYSVMKLNVNPDGEKTWLYWQEHKGIMLTGTEVETDYDTPPMWPGWLIPVYGEDWGRSYCEEYRGDLYTMEAHASATNDGASLAALSLLFVKPGSVTSIKQIREAKNLSTLSGSADDLTVSRAEKGGDFNFVLNNMETIARRLSAAFLLQVAVQRTGERVTAEEIKRIGSELDKALGGLYTQLSQGNQRVIIMRAMRLHEEDDKELPELPNGIVEVQVVTGVDALGQTTEAQNLRDWAETAKLAYPETFEKRTNGGEFSLRLAVAQGIKPDGLILTEEQVTEQDAKEQQNQMMQTVADKATGPAVAGIAAMAQNPQGNAPSTPTPQ